MLLSVFLEKIRPSLKLDRRQSRLLLCVALGMFSGSSHAYDLVLNCGDVQRTLVLKNQIAIDADGSILASSERLEDCLSNVTDEPSAGDGEGLLELTCRSNSQTLTRSIVVSDPAQSDNGSQEALMLLADNSGARVNAVNGKDCADPTPSLDSFSAGGGVSNGGVVRVDGNSNPKSVSLSWNAPLADGCSVVGSLLEVLGTDFGKNLPKQSPTTGLSIPLGGVSSDAAYSVGIQCQREDGVLQSEFAGISICGVGRKLPEDWSRQLDCVRGGDGAGATCTKWSNLWGTSFAESTGKFRNIVMSRNQVKEYVSLQFQMQSEESRRFGSLDTRGTVQYGRGPVNSEMIITVSECPGDFDRDLILEDGGCYHSDKAGLTSSTAWQGPNSSVSRGCKLAEQRNYFLNIIHSYSDPGTKPSDLEVHPNCDNFYGCGAQWLPNSFESPGN